MNIFVPSILIGLGGKCLLNWALVFVQRSHICRSFVGVFSVSLAITDTMLTLVFICSYIYGDGRLFYIDLQLTKYHICLLVQIIGQVHSALQWPVVLVASLDHFSSIFLQTAASRVKWIIHLFVTVLLWSLAVLYVFLLSDFVPVLEDVSHHQLHKCWASQTTRVLQISTLLFLTLGCAVLHSVFSEHLLNNPPLKGQIADKSRNHYRRSVIFQVLHIFMNTWAPFLVFLAVLILLPVGIPSYLDLNAAWLCFLNSFLIAAVLCVACPTSQLAQGLAAAPPDSFCEWGLNLAWL